MVFISHDRRSAANPLKPNSPRKIHCVLPREVKWTNPDEFILCCSNMSLVLGYGLGYGPDSKYLISHSRLTHTSRKIKVEETHHSHQALPGAAPLLFAVHFQIIFNPLPLFIRKYLCVCNRIEKKAKSTHKLCSAVESRSYV